jgi:DNA-binding MarR family transcriptional regulator
MDTIVADTSDQLPQLGPLDRVLGYHLRRASAVLGTGFSRAMYGTMLHQVPFATLSVVAANPGIKQGAAGRLLGIQRANMVTLVNELVDAGYIDRSVAKDDRRAFTLSVTPMGESALRDGVRAILQQEAHLLSDLNTAERELLINLLRRIEAREPPPAE